MPSLVVMQLQAGKVFGAETAMMSSTQGLGEQLSGRTKQLYVDMNKYHVLVQALGKVPCCLR